MVRSRFESGERRPPRLSDQAAAFATAIAVTSTMLLPSTSTASDSGLSRAPWQALQGTAVM